MGESPFLSHEEYELMKVPLERSEVPADALAALTAWIERERLLVDDPALEQDLGFAGRLDVRMSSNGHHGLIGLRYRAPPLPGGDRALRLTGCQRAG